MVGWLAMESSCVALVSSNTFRVSNMMPSLMRAWTAAIAPLQYVPSLGPMRSSCPLPRWLACQEPRASWCATSKSGTRGSSGWWSTMIAALLAGRRRPLSSDLLCVFRRTIANHTACKHRCRRGSCGMGGWSSWLVRHGGWALTSPPAAWHAACSLPARPAPIARSIYSSDVAHQENVFTRLSCSRTDLLYHTRFSFSA